MGTSLLCDGCGADIQTMDRINVGYASIETGSIQVDLCFPCSEPMRQTEIWLRIIEESAISVAADNERRQAIIAKQQEEFNARAEIALQQQKEANAAMREKGEV